MALRNVDTQISRAFHAERLRPLLRAGANSDIWTKALSPALQATELFSELIPAEGLIRVNPKRILPQYGLDEITEYIGDRHADAPCLTRYELVEGEIITVLTGREKVALAKLMGEKAIEAHVTGFGRMDPGVQIGFVKREREGTFDIATLRFGKGVEIVVKHIPQEHMEPVKSLLLLRGARFYE